jgi:ornithine carbamoyltransferase
MLAARLLGRLYDAVACQGLPEKVVTRLRQHTAIPVYDGIASPRHPIARVADMLDDLGSQHERRRLVLQAVLLGTIA